MPWYYESPFGKMEIRKVNDRKYVLSFDGEDVSFAHTPQAIADNVFTHTSEIFEWDDSDFEGPIDLSAWDYRVRS